MHEEIFPSGTTEVQSLKRKRDSLRGLPSGDPLRQGAGQDSSRDGTDSSDSSDSSTDHSAAMETIAHSAVTEPLDGRTAREENPQTEADHPVRYGVRHSKKFHLRDDCGSPVDPFGLLMSCTGRTLCSHCLADFKTDDVTRRRNADARLRKRNVFKRGAPEQRTRHRKKKRRRRNVRTWLLTTIDSDFHQRGVVLSDPARDVMREIAEHITLLESEDQRTARTVSTDLLDTLAQVASGQAAQFQTDFLRRFMMDDFGDVRTAPDAQGTWQQENANLIFLATTVAATTPICRFCSPKPAFFSKVACNGGNLDALCFSPDCRMCPGPDMSCPRCEWLQTLTWETERAQDKLATLEALIRKNFAKIVTGRKDLYGL